ncbi:MAG: DegT/DnrJ/EryC1/StrS family aminotransferase [Acidobacteriota bacterium]|nr:DegT/DnrJ/EryC1/StrS family aminotransferase [Acidobacteriota bacterium]
MTAPRIAFLSLHPGEDREAVDAAIQRVVTSGWFVLGPEVDAFEAEFAAASGAPHAVAVGNGTDAIALALRALDIGPGDEVITSPLSAAFSALAILMAGARPVFADIDPEHLTIDPYAIEAAITPWTRAVLPVHLYGQPADMPAIMAVARRHRLAVVEDCCQAHLATCAGRPVGTFGDAGAFSFYPTKNLGALGDAGAVVVREARLAGRLRRLRNGGQTARAVHGEAGVNSRMDELQAAVLRARLPYLARWTARRRGLAARYREGLLTAPVTVPPLVDPGHACHLFPIRSPQRDALRTFLAGQGIETLAHYPMPISRQPALAASSPAVCAVADRVCAELLSLPLYPALSGEAIDEVSRAVRAFAPVSVHE